MFRSRRGTSYIVEASLIYPVIVAVTVMLLAVTVYIYGLTAACSDLNRVVRREAGKKSATVFYNETEDPDTVGRAVAEEEGILFKKVTAVSERSYVSNIVFRVLCKNQYRAEAYVICEADTLWNRQAVGHAVDTLKE